MVRIWITQFEISFPSIPVILMSGYAIDSAKVNRRIHIHRKTIQTGKHFEGRGKSDSTQTLGSWYVIPLRVVGKIIAELAGGIFWRFSARPATF